MQSAVNLLQTFSFSSKDVVSSDGRLLAGSESMGGLPSLVADLNISTVA